LGKKPIKKKIKATRKRWNNDLGRKEPYLRRVKGGGPGKGFESKYGCNLGRVWETGGKRITWKEEKEDKEGSGVPSGDDYFYLSTGAKMRDQKKKAV